MKKLMLIAGLAALLGGCATSPPPSTEPGTGYGAAYNPQVSMVGVDPARYQSDVAECRTAAQRVTARRDENYGMWGAFALGLSQIYPNGIVAGLATWGVTSAFVDMASQPDARLVAEHQQISLVNCMAQRGYRNLDPNVRVTHFGQSFDTSEPVARRTGIDTYNAEVLAKARRCTVQPRAVLTAKGPGYEAYSVPCDNRAALSVRCEFGNCRAL